MNVTTARKSKMIGWIALGITAVVIVLICLKVDDWGRDWTQNTASLDPDAKDAALRPVEMDVDPDIAATRLEEWVRSESKWSLVSRSDPGVTPVKLHLTRTTPILRFVDDIEVTIAENPEADGVIVRASSRSRVGKGDLGQNPRNLKELTAAIR